MLQAEGSMRERATGVTISKGSKGARMKAVVCTKYGPADGLELKVVDKPSPKANEVLIKVHAATVTAGDVVLRSLTFAPLFWLPVRTVLGLPPRKTILGHELAGEVESVGREVGRFRKGDKVFGTTTGLRVGSYAEYVCLPEDAVLALKPANVTFEEAAAVPVGGLTALHFLRKGYIQSGQRALIYGASGSVGSFAVQLAKHFGAEVTAVCSARNLEWVKSLGADEVIDYTAEDFTERGALYDVIFDAVGKVSESDSRKALAPNGAFVTTKRGIAKESTEDLVFLKALIESGQVTTVIDRRYPLEQIAEAHRHVESGHKKGNVIITVGRNSET